MAYDILRAIELQKFPNTVSGFRRIKLKSGASLNNYRGTQSDVAVLVSGHVRAYLRYGDQEIAVFNAVPGFPIVTTLELVLRARKDSVLLVGPRAAFLEIALSTPDMYWPLYTGMEKLLAQTLRIIEAVRFLDVRARLILYIIELCEQQGQTMQDGVSIPFEYTIEDVANEIGSTRPTTSQILNKLIKEKFVRRLSRKQLIVTDLERLKETLRGADQMQCAHGCNPRCDACVENRPLLSPAPRLARKA